MKKTENIMLVIYSMNHENIYRRVYEENGKFFIKYNHEIIDVTNKQEHFIKDYLFR